MLIIIKQSSQEGSQYNAVGDGSFLLSIHFKILLDHSLSFLLLVQHFYVVQPNIIANSVNSSGGSWVF